MNNDAKGAGAPPIEQKDGSDPDRRAFLTRSGALVALLATSCTTTGEGDGVATYRNAEAVALNRVVDQAIANGGNLDLAVSQSGARLSSQSVSVLRSLTSEDWRAAGQLSERLIGLRRHVAGNNNGIFGM